MQLSNINKRLWLAILFVVVVPALISTSMLKAISSSETVYSCLFFLLLGLRTLVIFYLIRFLIKRFHIKYIANKQAEKKTNRALLTNAIVVLFLLLETVFMFVPQSQDLYKLGLANKVWQAYYKHNPNEKGYRDLPLKNRINTNKQKVFFLGDSFTYGNGIKQNEDRFTNMVSDSLDAKKFECFNLGKGNSDTRDEFEHLVNFGAKPNHLILQYYHNDIEKIGERHGHFNLDKTGSKKNKSTGIKKTAIAMALVPLQISFFLNYIGFNSSKFMVPKNQNTYKDCLNKTYNDTTCVNEQLHDLNLIITYCKLNNTKLYVVFIPDVRDIDYTQGLFNKYLIPYLEQNQVTCITVDKAFKDHTPDELAVNPLNAHTNAFANAIIARQILHSVAELRP